MQSFHSQQLALDEGIVEVAFKFSFVVLLAQLFLQADYIYIDAEVCEYSWACNVFIHNSLPWRVKGKC